jgi:hypothetical protein
MYFGVKYGLAPLKTNYKNKDEVFPNYYEKPPVTPEWRNSSYTKRERKNHLKNE